MLDTTGLIERRITIRLLAYWEKLRRGRDMPAEDDLDPKDLHDMWDHCFLVQVNGGDPDYHYAYLGPAIIAAYHGKLTPSDAELLVSPHAEKMAGHYRQIVESGKPVVDEGEFHNASNQRVKYRQCLLPLGQEGRVVAIFGGMRYRIST